MAVFKCKMCGGALEIIDGTSVAVCSYCGTKQTVPKLDNETRINLYDRANHFRRNNDYDKAMFIYEQILEADKTDAEAYWSILLCKYGIEYVEDPNTHKIIPTINRSQYTSIFADEDYKSAIRYADGYQKDIYEEEAHQFDAIQKGILAISQKEKAYDIFICYKETDANGKRTQDSVLAQDLYYQLTGEGYKVFFSRISLEDKLGTAYEPYIFAALNSSKIMVVLGTKPENFTSVWVKNEWSRFLALIKKDHSKVLIPAYRDMDPYDLPEDFSHLQAQDMSKLGFVQDLVRGIKKIINKNTQKPTEKETIVMQDNVQIAPLLKRAFIFLDDGNWTDADEYCEKVLDHDPENAEAYLGKMLAELQINTKEDLKDCQDPFDTNKNYKKILKYSPTLGEELNCYISMINERNRQAVLLQKYNTAVYLMTHAQNHYDYITASKMFEEISEFKDSNLMIQACREKVCIFSKNEKYDLAKKYMQKNTIEGYNQAKDVFKNISGWKDADDLSDKCTQKIDELIALEKEKCIAQKRKKKIAIIVMAIIAIVIVVAILTTTIFIPLSKYNNAQKYVKSGDYTAALEEYKALDGFGDSEEVISTLEVIDKVDSLLSKNYIDSAIYCLFDEQTVLTINYDCAQGQMSQQNLEEKQSIVYNTKKYYEDNKVVPVRTGYSFDKWVVSNYNIAYDFNKIQVEINVEASWEIETYVVTYDLNDGYVIGLDISDLPENYSIEDEITLPNLAKIGYTFVGWTGTDLKKPTIDVVIPVGSTGDRNYEAVWEANEYAITLDANGGSVAKSQITVKYGQSVSLPKPQYDGYVFLGWSWLEKPAFSINLKKWNVTDSITLTAKWEVNEYKIFYYLDGGICENPTGYTIENEDILLVNPTREGYTFVGWTGTDLSEKTMTVTIPQGSYGKRSYTANWEANINTVVFDANGGSGTMASQTGATDNTIILNSSTFIPPQDYWFVGWATSENGDVVYSDGAEYKIGTQSTYTLYAIYDTFAYELNDAGDAYILTNFGACKDIYVVVPSLYNGLPVTSIAAEAFANYSNMTSIIIPNSITNIGCGAFSGCSALESITIPFVGDRAGVTSSDTYRYPFGYIFGMSSYDGGTATKQNYYIDSVSYDYDTEYYIPSSLKSVTITGGDIFTEAFLNCQNLVNITMPNSITYIGDRAFSNCTELVNITIPSSVTSIGTGAFYSCEDLTNITIPNSVTSIGTLAFANCNGLKEVCIPDNTSNMGDQAFLNCTSLTKIIGPCKYVSSIAKRCGSMSYSVIITSDTTINTDAFKNCIGMISIEMYDGITNIGSAAFYGCAGLTNINIPHNVTTISDNVFCGCTGLNHIALSNNILSISTNAFANCSSLNSITLGEGLTYLGTDAFVGCYKLVEIINLSLLTITKGSTDNGYIGYYAKDIYTSLDYTSKLSTTEDGYIVYTDGEEKSLIGYTGTATELTLPNDITLIYKYAFFDCTDLTSIVIPNNVTSIGEGAFRGCSALESMTIPFVGNRAGVTSSDTYQYPFGYIFGSNSYDGGTKTTQSYYGSSISLITSTTYYIPSSLKSVTITGGNILYGAFYNCSNLTSITIPSSVTSIGDSAFSGCAGLISMTIPNNVTSIGNSAFARCTSFACITIPSSVASIEDGAFYYCTGLTSIAIPNNVTNIGESAFKYCMGLVIVNWNAIACTNAGSSEYPIFSGCTSLTTINIGDNVTTIPSYAFKDCTDLTIITISDSVTSIGKFAFQNCTSLASITIPDSVTSIESGAFSGCSALKSMTIPFVGAKAGVANSDKYQSPFGCIFGTTSYTGGTATKQYYKGESTGNGTTFYIPSTLKSVTIIGGNILYGAFYNCSSLTNITIQSSVTSIGSHAFYNCIYLTSISIGSGVTSIGDYAFNNCLGLTNVIIGNGVTSIGEYAFQNCTSLMSVSLPDGIIKIATTAFSSCTSLQYNEYGSAYYLGNDTNPYLILIKAKDKSISVCNINNNTKIIQENAFSGCTSLINVTIGNSVTRIGNCAFYNCTGLTTVNWNATACTYAGSSEYPIFKGCANLAIVNIGDNVTTIPEYAFRGCKGLTSITIGSSVTSIGYEAFYECTSLTSVSLPNGVTKIGTIAFYNCTSLTSIIIPSSVTRIGSRAFSGCSNLATIYCEATSQPSGWDSDWKSDCSATVVWGYMYY